MRLNKENNINIIYRVVISTLIVLTILEIFVYPDMSNLFGCITFILGWILLYNIVLRTNKIKCFLPYFSMLGLGLSFFWLPLIITFIEGKPLTFRFENPYLTFFNQFLNLIMLICSYRFCFSIYRQNNIIHNLWERIGYFRAPSDKQVWALSIIGFLSYVYILTIQGTDQAESENLGIAGHFLQVLKGFASFPVILLFKNIYGGKGRYTNYLFLSIYFVIFIVLGIATGKRGAILMPFAALFMCYILPSILYNKKIFSSRNTIIIIVLVYLATGPVADLAMAMALGRDNQGHTSSVNTFDNITQLYNDKETLHNMYQAFMSDIDNGGDNDYGWSEYYVDNILLDRFCNLRVCDATLYYATKLGYDNEVMHKYLKNYITFQIPSPILKLFGNSQNKFENAFTPGDLISTQGLGLKYQYKGYRVAGDTGIGLYLWGYKYYLIAFFIYSAFFYFLSTIVDVRNKTVILPLPQAISLMGIFFTFNNSIGICKPISTLLRTGWQDILVYCLIYWFVRKFFK